MQLVSAIGLLFALCSVSLSQAFAQSLDAPVPSPRIVGGQEVSIDQVPATVALLNSQLVFRDGDYFQAQFCGGTVIAPQWVLTAAHCVVTENGTPFEPSRVMVLSGSTDLRAPINQPIAVRRIIAHPDFVRVELGQDIALLELEIDSQVAPVLLDSNPISLSDPAFIAGWGAVNAIVEGRSQSFPRRLRGASVEMTPGEVCGALFPEYVGLTNPTVICAGVDGGGKDSCQGDSGGPLYRLDSLTGEIVSLVGITSWGISCGNAAFPGIYTNAASYIDWIQANTRSIAERPANDAVVATSSMPDDLATTGTGGGSAGDTRSSGSGAGLYLPALILIASLGRRFWARRYS